MERDGRCRFAGSATPRLIEPLPSLSGAGK